MQRLLKDSLTTSNDFCGFDLVDGARASRIAHVHNDVHNARGRVLYCVVGHILVIYVTGITWTNKI